MGRKKQKNKPVNFELIPESSNKHIPEPYRLLAEVRKKWHENLDGARIALAWRKNWKADKDCHLVLGMCVKATDLQKEFANFDFVILLNREVWESLDFTVEKKRALIDHELCHADFSPDKYGGHRVDERGRTIWRIRSHDIEEFSAVVARHGCYKHDLERFAKVLLEKANTPLLSAAEQKAVEPQKAAAAVN